MTNELPRATDLTPEQVTELRERARREAGPFTNPRVLATPIHNGEWAGEILGHPYAGPHTITWPERYLLHIATKAEPTPPPPPQTSATLEQYRALEAERRTAAETEHRRRAQEWEALESALRDVHGVRVVVRHNYTSHRHGDGFTQGADHVYLLDDLTAGRLRRTARQVLCWTPSRARDLRVIADTDEDGWPTCRTCLRIARRLADRPA
ncbi:hypothetical protein [Embleya sp. NPDC001921]